MDEEVARQMGSLAPYFITSSEDKTGRDEVLDYIDQINATLE